VVVGEIYEAFDCTTYFTRVYVPYFDGIIWPEMKIASCIPFNEFSFAKHHKCVTLFLRTLNKWSVSSFDIRTFVVGKFSLSHTNCIQLKKFMYLEQNKPFHKLSSSKLVVTTSITL
jgi:hypothetical protein